MVGVMSLLVLVLKRLLCRPEAILKCYIYLPPGPRQLPVVYNALALKQRLRRGVIPFNQHSSSVFQVLCSLGAASQAWAVSSWNPNRRLMAPAPRRTMGV